jgi:protein-S-isoprenylcysteine O-methyltransferase Ste14
MDGNKAHSLAYDRLMRLPIVLFTSFFFFRELFGLGDVLARPPLGWDWHFMCTLAARISLLIFLGLLIFFHTIRSRPVSRASGWEPKISAVLGLTLGNVLLLLDRSTPSPMLDLASTLLLLLGNYLCVVVLLHLGRSVSIMAEARKLVTSGPYRVIRHPLYLAEQIAIVGIFLQFMSWQAALVLLLHFVFQVRRMLNEERILTETFPQYREYAARTSRLIPGVW